MSRQDSWTLAGHQRSAASCCRVALAPKCRGVVILGAPGCIATGDSSTSKRPCVEQPPGTFCAHNLSARMSAAAGTPPRKFLFLQQPPAPCRGTVRCRDGRPWFPQTPLPPAAAPAAPRMPQAAAGARRSSLRAARRRAARARGLVGSASGRRPPPAPWCRHLHGEMGCDPTKHLSWPRRVKRQLAFTS